MKARRLRSADSVKAAGQTENNTTALKQSTETRMAQIRVGNETITVNTNRAEQEAGLKALCDGFNAQKEMRQEATVLMREIRHEMRRIEQAYTAVMKPKDDLPAAITALSLLTASLEDMLESLREHAVRVACSKNLEESFMEDPRNLGRFLDEIERGAMQYFSSKYGNHGQLDD
jgi:hypothetical protein